MPPRNLGGLSPLILDRDARTQRRATMLNDDLAGEASNLIELFLHRDAFNDVSIRHLASDFGENGQRVRIPFDQFLSQLDTTTVFHLDLGAINDSVLLTLTPCLIDNGDLGIPIHDDPFTLFILHRNSRVREVGIFLGIEAHELDSARMLGFSHRLLNHFCSPFLRCGTSAWSAVFLAHRSTAPQ